MPTLFSCFTGCGHAPVRRQVVCVRTPAPRPVRASRLPRERDSRYGMRSFARGAKFVGRRTRGRYYERRIEGATRIGGSDPPSLRDQLPVLASLWLPTCKTNSHNYRGPSYWPASRHPPTIPRALTPPSAAEGCRYDGCPGTTRLLLGEVSPRSRAITLMASVQNCLCIGIWLAWQARVAQVARAYLG